MTWNHDLIDETRRFHNGLSRLIPQHSYALEVRFWGPGLKFVRVALNTEADAFGDAGGAEVEEEKRVIPRSAKKAVFFEECAMPFELITVTESAARYSVTAGETELEATAGRFIAALQGVDSALAAFHSLVVSNPVFSLYYGVKAGHDSVTATLTRRIPRPKTSSKRRDEEDIITW